MNDNDNLIEAILNGERDVIMCGTFPQSIPCVSRVCELCDVGVAMDKGNVPKVAELKLVVICMDCGSMLSSMSVSLCGKPADLTAMINGKEMTMEEGAVQVELLRNRN